MPSTYTHPQLANTTKTAMGVAAVVVAVAFAEEEFVNVMKTMVAELVVSQFVGFRQSWRVLF